MVLWLKVLNAGRKIFQHSSDVRLRSFAIQQRTMTEHLERTAHNVRQPGVSEAVVTSIQDVSPTVKHLTLKVESKEFSYKPGQWVDFFIPGVEVFTGFSMCSAPNTLDDCRTLELAVQFSDHPPTLWVHEKVPNKKQWVDFVIPSIQTVGGYSMSSAPSSLSIDRSLQLAVKYSDHAPAHWVHKQCKVGDRVGLRVGGDQIIYDPRPSDPRSDCLLLAGGIGINPLMSIIQHVAHLHHNKLYDLGRVRMLYSASSLEELIFKKAIEDICEGISDVHCHFFVTKEKLRKQDQQSTGESNIITHRIDRASLADALEQLDKSRLRCYICGPPTMIASMETLLQDLGVEKSNLHSEKWW